MRPPIQLREVEDADVRVFFEHQRDKEAVHRAAFTHEDPSDCQEHLAHWRRIRADSTVLIRTVLVDDQVVGHVASFEMMGQREVTYWIDRQRWGRGHATSGLRAFLEVDPVRPLHARVAKDNHASIRVLQKCGFLVVGEDRGFAHGRGCEVEELVLMLEA